MPSSPATAQLHAAVRDMLAATWCQRVLVRVSETVTGPLTSRADVARALDEVDAADPDLGLLALAVREGDQDALHAAVSRLRARQEDPQGAADWDDTALASWVRSQTMDLPVALALVEMRCAAPVAAWLSARLEAKGWLPDAQARRVGQAFVLDWVDLASGVDPVAHYTELLGPSDPSLREPSGP